MKISADVLEKVRLYEGNNRIRYAKIDGSLYKSVKSVYFLAVLFTLVMNFFFVMGNVLSKDRFEVFENSVYMVVVLSVLLILALVLIKFKDYCLAHISAFLLNVGSSVCLTVVFARQLEDVVGYKTSFYWRHFAPLCLIVLLSFWATIIAVRAILKTQKSYKIVMENIPQKESSDFDGYEKQFDYNSED